MTGWGERITVYQKIVQDANLRIGIRKESRGFIINLFNIFKRKHLDLQYYLRHYPELRQLYKDGDITMLILTMIRDFNNLTPREVAQILDIPFSEIEFALGVKLE